MEIISTIRYDRLPHRLHYRITFEKIVIFSFFTKLRERYVILSLHVIQIRWRPFALSSVQFFFSIAELIPETVLP